MIEGLHSGAPLFFTGIEGKSVAAIRKVSVCSQLSSASPQPHHAVKSSRSSLACMRTVNHSIQQTELLPKPAKECAASQRNENGSSWVNWV